MSLVDVLTSYCEGVIIGCSDEIETLSVFESFRRFSQRWIPDPHCYLGNNGVITNFEEGLQFLVSEVLAWTETEFFDTIKKIREASDETDVPQIKCLALLLAIVCALRSSEQIDALGGDSFSMKLNEYLGEREDKVFFMNILESVCWSKSATEFCESELFQTILNNYYVDHFSETDVNTAAPPTSSISPNETVSNLNMSSLDLNRSMAALSPALSNFVRKQNRQSHPRYSMAATRMDSLASENDEDRSAVFSSSMNRSFSIPAVPPLCNPRLSQSSPYTKLAQKNKSISVKYDLLCHEVEELRQDYGDTKTKLEQTTRENVNLKAQVSSLCRELMDCRDEKVALEEQNGNLEKKNSGLSEALEKALAELKELKNELDQMKSRERKLNVQMEQTQQEKYSLERKVSQLSKEKSEMSEFLKSEAERWTEQEQQQARKMNKLEEALSEVSNYKRELVKQVQLLTDEKAELESDMHLKLSSETCKMEEKIQEREIEIERLKTTCYHTEHRLHQEENRVSELSKERHTLEDRVREKDAAINTMQSEWKQKEKELHNRVEDLTSAKKEAHDLCSELRSQLHELTCQMKQASVDHGIKIKEALQTADSKVAAVKQDTEQTITCLHSQLEDKENTIQLLKASEREKGNEVGLLTSRVAKLSGELEGREERLRGREQVVVELEGEVRRQKETVAQLNEHTQQLKVDFEESQKQLEARLEEEKRQFEHSLEQKNVHIEHINLRIATLQSEVGELRMTKSELEGEVDARDRRGDKDRQEWERERAHLQQEINSLAQKTKHTEVEIKTLKDEGRKREREAVEKVYSEASGLREQVDRLTVELNQQQLLLSQTKSEKAGLEGEVGSVRLKMEALEKTHLVEVDKLRLQINTLTDEKQIVQESLEIENMNLTDQLLQATGQMEVLAAQRDSLQAEKGQLVQNCEQARHDYNTLTAHNSTLEEDLKKAHGAMERLHEKLEQVSSYGADDRRTSEEQIAELQLKVAELEEKAAESEDLRGIIATMEKKLASSDNTLKSYKKLYMDEKARSQQSQHHLARSHTYSPDRGVSQKENVLPMLSHRIKQEATVTGGDVHYERPVTRQVVSTSNLNDRFETLPARSRVPLSGSSSTTFSTPSMKLRSRVMASQNFADSVPNEESLYKFSDVLDMIHPDMASVQTRMSDLQRQENVLPKSLLTLSSYPTDTITSSSQSTVAQASTSSLHSAENNVMSGLRNRQHPPNSHLRNNLNWTSTSSSSSSSSLLSGSGTSTGSETLARTVPHINLPGYVPSREMRGLSGQTLDSSGKRSSMMWISANQGPGEARGHGQDEDEDEGLNSEDRMSEIERRNSMYPRHLQSCYPMENLTDSTGSATRAAASGGRKRPMHLTSSMDMCEDDNLNSTGVENNPPSGSTGTAPRGAKQVKRGNVLPDRMNHPPLSGSDCLFSPEARMTASPFRSCLPPSVKKLKKGHTPLTMPSPQKLVQRVTKGRRSKVGPMDTVPEKSSGSKQDQQSSSASASSGDGATGGGDKSGTGGSVFMEFPNTPKDKKRKKKSGLLG